MVSNSNLLSTFQHAYCEGHSASTAPLQMSDDWLSCMDNKELVCTDHTLLVDELQCYGFTSNALSWFIHYLSGQWFSTFFASRMINSFDVKIDFPDFFSISPECQDRLSRLFDIFSQKKKKNIYIYIYFFFVLFLLISSLNGNTGDFPRV